MLGKTYINKYMKMRRTLRLILNTENEWIRNVRDMVFVFISIGSLRATDTLPMKEPKKSSQSD